MNSIKLKLALGCLVAFTLSGCFPGATMTLWKSAVQSPTGKYTALVQTDNTDTIGNVEYTIVRIKENGSWRGAKKLIVFDGGIDYEQDFHMKWDSPSHLDIVVDGYGPAPAPYHAVDQIAPITFSVHYVQKPYQPTS